MIFWVSIFWWQISRRWFLQGILCQQRPLQNISPTQRFRPVRKPLASIVNSCQLTSKQATCMRVFTQVLSSGSEFAGTRRGMLLQVLLAYQHYNQTWICCQKNTKKHAKPFSKAQGGFLGIRSRRIKKKRRTPPAKVLTFSGSTVHP